MLEGVDAQVRSAMYIAIAIAAAAIAIASAAE